MTQVTINGNTYSDDGSSARDMLHGGHRTWFLPMAGDVTTVAGVVADQAAQTAIDAINAANGAAATKGTSTTFLTVSAGTKTLATQPGKQFTAGNFVTISRTSEPATMMHGVVTSYSGTSLVVSVAVFAGSGTYTDWTISLSGPQGAPGASGDGSVSYLAKTGAYTITAADKAKLIDCTSGTFTLSFQACATLGSTWSTHIRNSGAGVITLDPNASETIEGAASFSLGPGVAVKISCDGTTLRIILLSSFRSGVFQAADKKSSGTAGGTSVSGVNTRTLNTVDRNTIAGASLASSQITLPPGGYFFCANATVSIGSGGHRLSLYNVTGETPIAVGINASAPPTGTAYPAEVSGAFTLTATTVVELRHYISAGISSFGLGWALSTGDQEVYAKITLLLGAA